MENIDFSHTVYDGFAASKGLPAPHIFDFLTREAFANSFGL